VPHGMARSVPHGMARSVPHGMARCTRSTADVSRTPNR
jgi:hypothetical protein